MESFESRVFQFVAGIPHGKVATYGQIAAMLGMPRNARHVGRVLGRAPDGLPCHRVVNASGRTVPGWVGQRALLENEGVRFRENGNVDLKSYRYRRD